jgi:branched-subunit amino acid aminotransferase/4-amino-4-deoxychorismate lyase
MLPYTYYNGQIVPAAEARVNMSDLGLIRGYGIFDYFLFDAGEPRYFDDYLDRFTRSAALLRLPIPLSRAGLKEQVRGLIRANAQPNGGIRLLLTGGDALDGYTPRVPNFAIIQYPRPQVTTRLYEQGAHLLSYRHVREMAHIKTTNYLTGIFVQERLRSAQADYVLYHDGEWISESDRSNVFIVTPEGVLATPGEKILEGITRKQILAKAKALGIPTEVRPVSLREVRGAREVIISSTIKGAMPATRLDSKPIGDGQPGPITQQLQAAMGGVVG